MRERASNEVILPIDQSFDSALANELARLETYNKHLYRPNTYLHKWWARRCGTTFRLLLKHLVADEEKRDFYAPGGLEGKVVLDPMMGGGTTLHEAIRLGANVAGMDIDPIPVLQARASLADIPVERLEAAFTHLMGGLDIELGAYYMTECPKCDRPATLRFMMYGLQRWCDCGPAIIIDSLVLRHEADGRSVSICATCYAVGDGMGSCHCLNQSDRPPLREKKDRVCPNCGIKYQDDLAAPFFARYFPLVTVGHCEDHGTFFTSVQQCDLNLIEQANATRPGLKFGASLKVDPGPKSIDLIRRGVNHYSDLFSSRQLLYLNHSIHLLAEYDPQIRLYLALLVSTSLEFNTMLCGYKGAGRRRAGAIRHAFSHHAYSFPYTAVENNPIFKRPSSGTLRKLFHDRVRRAKEWAQAPQERTLDARRPTFREISGEVDYGLEIHDPVDLGSGTRRYYVSQGSSASIDLADDSVDYIVTDPPYYDSVQYSDLAAFFRVWLRQLLPEYQVLGINWDYAMKESAVRWKSGTWSSAGGDQYLQLLSKIFQECHRVLRKDFGRLVFSFHHWNPDGWAALTLALKRADFVLLNRFVVHSENPTSVHINNLRALTDDAIMVFAAQDPRKSIQWERPALIDANSSAQFCSDCATLLGWMLGAKLPETEIIQLWGDSIGF